MSSSSCSICYDTNNIKNDYCCRVCKESPCNECFCNILLHDLNFTFCFYFKLPIIYKCAFCNSSNRIKCFNKDIQNQLIELLEKKHFNYIYNI